jgi:HlyD family secretion protein
MDWHHAPGRPLRRIGRAAGGAVLVALTVASCSTDESTQPPVATVERGVVTTGVSANGSLSAITQQNMGFPNGGQLTNVFVKVGDHVEAGQVLATIDDFALRQTQLQQEGELRSQQAALDRLVNSPVSAGAQDSLDKAQEIVDATRNQSKAVLDAAEVAIDNAERQHSVDKDALDDAKDRLSRSRKACGDDNPYSLNDSDSSDDRDSSNDSQSAGDSRPSGEDAPSGDADASEEGDSSRDSGDSEDRGSSDESDSSDDSGSFEVEPSSWTSSRSATLVWSQDNPAACSAVPSDEAAVNAAEQQVAASQTALKNAQQQRDLDKANGELAVKNAEQTVVNARNTADTEKSDRPFDIEEQRGALMAQQAAVASAQRDVENATLKAPVAGTVSVLNGVVGEYLSPSSGTTALAPGSGAAIPGADNASQSAAASAGGVATPTRPGGAEFLMLDNIDAFQVVVPFNESDAATIAPSQKVNVVLDALPDLTLTGTVLSVAPSGTAISGVISYYVTVVVDGKDPRLKDGQTARATIVTEEVNNVLTVPSSAVRQENGKSVVTVIDTDGAQRPIPFEPGTVGQDRTQVISGLREGQQILLPVAR